MSTAARLDERPELRGRPTLCALLSGRYQGDELDQVVAARLYRQRILDTEFTAHLVLTEIATALHTDTRDVADYVHRFEIYAGLADYGDAAAATLARLAAEYRAL